MARVKWDEPGEHFYQHGVDHGILYPKNGTGGGYAKGVPWNGLTSVSDSPEGGEANPFYADNVKYLNLMSPEDSGGTIEAYTYPDEFEVCDGTAEIATGVMAKQQNRVPFGLVYRTKIGSDDNPDEGYIIHVIYNAMAQPSEVTYETINDSPEPITFSWEYSTTPVKITDHQPSAHLKIYTNKLAEGKLELLEDKLYGTDPTTAQTTGTDPTLLEPDDLIDLIT